MKSTAPMARPFLRLAMGFFLTLIMLAAFLADHYFPFPAHRLHPAPAIQVLDQDGKPLRFFLAPDDMWRFPVQLQDVSPKFLKALIASEDKRFYQHPGIDPIAVLRAGFSNIRHGRIVSGASTIPMQVARMVAPKERTFRAKIGESLRALQLCAHYSKEEILTWYVNMAPFGGNVVGVKAAAWFYFGKSPKALSLGEIALLTVLPRSPAAYNPLKNPRAALAVRNRVLRQFAAEQIFPAQEITQSLARPLLVARHCVPQHAPHFTRWVSAQNPSATVLVTSLKRKSQKITTDLLAGRMQSLRQAGIHNAAAVVLDSKTRNILAYVGSADFWDEHEQGQVDNVLSKRSPGSALKPFLYAMAFDQGFLTPDSRLLDVPTDFAGYQPENYTHTYQGLVTARTALTLSLNLPAVRLLAQAGLENFYHLLQSMGLTTLDKPANHYGLSLALGSCEVRLLDLANLYATLARAGQFLPVRTLKDSSQVNAQQPLSPEACAITLGILSGVTRPDLPKAWELTWSAPSVAWKTGTSFGHRDAWALGVSQDLTIGVWVGNPDGSPCRGISGSVHAAPLLFELFRALSPGSTSLPHFPTPALITLPVCAESGDAPGPFCQSVMTQGIAGRTKLKPCTMHQRIFVDKKTGQRLHGDCLLSRPVTTRIVTLWPPELIAHARAQGMPTPELPEQSPDCPDVPEESGPQILSPSAETPYSIRADAPQSFQKIALLAAPAPGVTTHYWYVDGRFVAAENPQKPCFVSLPKGRHDIVVTDSLGRTARITIRVQDALLN